MDRSWLNQAESDTLVEFLLLMSDRGFPATCNRAIKYALEVGAKKRHMWWHSSKRCHQNHPRF
jgi:hypothetical protein